MYDFKEVEEEVLRFWKVKKIYEKLKSKNKNGKAFYLMDGPPYATGHIHIGTALNKILKDIVMRSRRIQGYDVFDRPGYDTHGVPIEIKIEKEIGSKNKADIEKYGVKKFVGKCKDYATKYIDVMNKEFENLGAWFDWDNPYLTLDDEYIEAIWWTFKRAYDKKLLYLGKYPIHVCPRCETAVAYNEIVYTNLEDNAVFVKFPLKTEKEKFLLIWTTTPWTLPGNTGVMVNPNIDYSEVKVNDEIWIIAKDLVEKIMGMIDKKCKILKTFKGEKLEGKEYINPLAKNLNLKNTKKIYKIVLSSRYVNTDEGSGLVHCAPGHGKEDYDVGKKAGLDIICPVKMSGLMTEEAGKYSGKKARIVDEEIKEDLKEMGMLVYEHKYKHDYPLCWRCNEPLLMVSIPQWFFKIEDIHKKLLSENDNINWIPKWMRLRMKAWLEGVSDWPISRKRYWGTPLPIWTCEKCQEIKVIANKKELQKLSGVKNVGMHKPEIDSIEIKCSKCKGKMKRVEEVLDVWFDSGVASWAALKYPRADNKFKKFWPADLNIEGKDQIRGWWNSQLILSIIAFDKKPFDSISVHGMVLDLGKKKMSKSLGNVVSPQDIIDKYGRDYMRYYFAKISKGEDFAFNEREFKDIANVFRVLINLNNFISQLNNKTGKLKIEDKWILSRLNNIIKRTNEGYNKYQLNDVVALLENFLVNEVSRTYIQFVRERQDEGAVKKVLDEIYNKLLIIFSPIIPFITEHLYKQREESVFFERFPKQDTKKINKKLEEDFEMVFQIIEKGLAERDKAKIGLKWPLAKAEIKTNKKINKELHEIIARQFNVKKIEVKQIKSGAISVKLDTKLTLELEAEGYAREISRAVQALRKKSGLVKTDKIELIINADNEIINEIKKHEEAIKGRTNAKKIRISASTKEKYKINEEIKIKGIQFNIGFNKL